MEYGSPGTIILDTESLRRAFYRRRRYRITAAEQPFSLVPPRRNKRTRKATSPQQQAQPQPQPAASNTQPAQVRRPRDPIVSGRSSAVGLGIAAAKKLRRKAVFYVDNINTTCSVEDVKLFASDLSVEVLLCHEVIPRRRGGDTKGRKAFRLCINADHGDRFLDASAWPDSILISDWYFKPRDERRGQDQRGQVGDQATSVASADNASVSSVVAVLRDDNDVTVVVSNANMCGDDDDDSEQQS